MERERSALFAFSKYRCAWCHVQGSPGLVPDLLMLTPEKHALFKQIVHGGALAPRGMASFADVLSEGDVEAIHAYIVEEARKHIAEAQPH